MHLKNLIVNLYCFLFFRCDATDRTVESLNIQIYNANAEFDHDQLLEKQHEINVKERTEHVKAQVV